MTTVNYKELLIQDYVNFQSFFHFQGHRLISSTVFDAFIEVYRNFEIMPEKVLRTDTQTFADILDIQKPTIELASTKYFCIGDTVQTKDKALRARILTFTSTGYIVLTDLGVQNIKKPNLIQTHYVTASEIERIVIRDN